MTPQQLSTLKTAVLADPNLAAARAADDRGAMAAYYNGPSAFVVWRTSLSEAEVVSATITDPTIGAGLLQSTFSWSQLIARTANEQFGWQSMFGISGYVNPSLANVRQAVADIFSGAQAAPTNQRNYLLAIAKRFATRAEALYATGTGSVASPGALVFEGSISSTEIDGALNN